VLGDEKDLFSTTAIIGECNFIPFEALDKPMRVTAKTRYSQKEAAATIAPLENGNVLLEFDTPQRAMTAGQAAVFYDGEMVVGGGKIIGIN
jgi:tRNA-specific 2-thiouridylase